MFISKKLKHQILAFSMRYVYGWVAPTLKRHQNPTEQLYFNLEQSSWIASLHEFGRMFGALVAGIVGLFLETYRENSSPEYRGIFGSVSIAFCYEAELIEFILTSYLSYNATAITNSITTFFALSVIFTLKESPQYLIMKRKYEKAESNFYWLKGTDEKKEDFAKLRQTIQEESANKLTLKKLATTSLYYKPVLIVLVLCMLQLLLMAVQPYYSLLTRIFHLYPIFRIAMVFSGGIHGLYFSIRSELFAQNVKEIGSSICIMGQSLCAFVSSKIFLYVSDMYGVYMNFVIFHIVCIFGVIYVYFTLPETRGKTLAEIQE
ncbi:hypothetical protein PGB90_001401 [Kerria lacca]